MAERPASTIVSADLAVPDLARCAAVAARFGGRIEPASENTDDADDAVVVVWGPSPASSDDAERAVRAGLELVLAGLATRVGLAADDADRAAAVRGAARPGEVLVTEQVRSRTSAAIRYTDRGRPEIPGEAEPSRLFRADGVVDVVGGSGRPQHIWAPLVGYQHELALIKDSLHAAIDESAGRLLVVAGEAGSGTTRLGSELEHYIDGLAGRIWWLWGRAASYGEATSYSSLVAVLRGRIAATDRDDLATLRGKLERTTAALAITEQERHWLTKRLLSLLVGHGHGGGPAFSQAELFDAWLFWFEHLGRTEPVVWVIDDAHLADDGLVAFTDHVVRRAGSPVLVLALGRPGVLDRFAGVGRPERSRTVRLDGLAPDELDTLADALVEDLSPSARALLVDAADGLPLYPVEQARYLADRGAAPEPAGWDLRAVIRARLDLLSDPDDQLLQAAAVLGPSFAVEVLAAVAGQDEGAVVEALARLSERDLVTRVGDPMLADFGHHAFVQPLVREVAYHRAPATARTRLHARAAAVIGARAGALAELALVVARHRVLAAEASAAG